MLRRGSQHAYHERVGGSGLPVPTGRGRKVGTVASSSATKSAVVGRKIRAKFVDLRGMLGEAEYKRLVKPAKADVHKRKAERMEERESQPPSVRTGAVHRWTPAALASYESSTMQGGESADKAPG